MEKKKEKKKKDTLLTCELHIFFRVELRHNFFFFFFHFHEHENSLNKELCSMGAFQDSGAGAAGLDD